MVGIFWISAFLIGYIYLGYPLLLKCLPKRPPSYPGWSDQWPLVTVLIPAFNEVDFIDKTIRNKLEQDYPADCLEIIVISDGSTDGTDERVKAISQKDPRVKLLRQEPRQGKTAGLNDAVIKARGDFVIFSDANSQYGPDALKALVHCFSDPEVGYVTGKMVYVNEAGNLVGDGCSAYMRYENNLREQETQVSSVIGVDGGIDAVRKSLYQPMNADQLPDFVLPLTVIAQGSRVVFCPAASLEEESLSSSSSELRMRVRVTLRAFWALWDRRELLNPLRFGLVSVQLVSHKLLRYMAFIPLIVAFLSSLVLADFHWVYALAALGQLAFYGAAAYTAFSEPTHSTWLNLSLYFTLINLAALIAFVRFIKGEKIVIWKPRGG